jgi:hypothetical protein
MPIALAASRTSHPVPRALALAFQQETLARAVAPEQLATAVDESPRVPAPVWREMYVQLLAPS